VQSLSFSAPSHVPVAMANGNEATGCHGPSRLDAKFGLENAEYFCAVGQQLAHRVFY